MFNGYILPPTQFVFGGGKTGPDKFRGLQKNGPYMAPDFQRPPKFGFLFPLEYRDHANRLYLALKNGIGYFRGLEAAFHIPLSKASVVQLTQFSLPPNVKVSDAARLYRDAIDSWLTSSEDRPDLVFIIHPRTAGWEDLSPYYESKAKLLQQGILSQTVTSDLIDNPAQFEWSVANIALAVFSKLGGTPWLIDEVIDGEDLILGMGRAGLFNPQSRTSPSNIGFTACFSSRGEFKFFSLAKVAENRRAYIASLEELIFTSLQRAANIAGNVSSLTLHVPKEFGHEEMEAIRTAVDAGNESPNIPIYVIKVTDEPDFFAVDPDTQEGLPQRGTVVQISDQNLILYTEGSEERQAWRQRTPTALRIAPQTDTLQTELSKTFIRQIHQLSQVNWRGFNARARPISIFYSQLIAKILSRLTPDSASELYTGKTREMLETSLWFL